MSASGGNFVKSGSDTSRKKMASAQRELYMKPLLRLKQQQDILERGLISAIENMKIDPNLIQDIMHEHRELFSKRQDFLDAMYKNINDINFELNSVKHTAKNPQDIQKLDVNTYKSKLIKLSQKMQDFKKSCPIRTLMEEGAALNTELNELDFNLEKYEKTQKDASLHLSRENIVENKKERTEYKDVDDFHDLVALTGHTGNWNSEDHLFFLKMRKKCDSIPALVAAMRKKYPDLSPETIVNHEAWFKHYEESREKQKAAVKEWRQRKELQKKKNVNEIDKEMENCSEDEVLRDENAIERTVSVRRKAKSSKSESRCTNSSADSNRSEKKEQIKKWKIEKENKRSMDEEQVKMQMKLKKEVQENQRKKRREKMQGALEEYKKKKSLENALREMDEHSKEKCKYDATLIKAFRKQDKEFTKKRKDLIRRSRKPSKSELVDVKRVELVETRDYSTLLNTTKVWREKCKVEDSTKHSNEFQYIKDVPKMCIRWRNEESEDLKI